MVWPPQFDPIVRWIRIIRSKVMWSESVKASKAMAPAAAVLLPMMVICVALGAVQAADDGPGDNGEDCLSKTLVYQWPAHLVAFEQPEGSDEESGKVGAVPLQAKVFGDRVFLTVPRWDKDGGTSGSLPGVNLATVPKPSDGQCHEVKAPLLRSVRVVTSDMDMFINRHINNKYTTSIYIEIYRLIYFSIYLYKIYLL